jgi:SAM-dependent methyltransferase
VNPANENWGADLRSWAIPDKILAAAPETPYGFPKELFRHRGERAFAGAPTPTTVRALEALPSGGSVLDVGAGGGATSVPLVDRAGLITGVDSQDDMLPAFVQAVERAGGRAESVAGDWLTVAPDLAVADVVVSGHVAYNVPDLAAFFKALHEHARHRVVTELTAHHPLMWMNDLWLTFHDVRRPTRPSADDAVAVLGELGVIARREERSETDEVAGGGFERREDAVALVRRRLCLGAERDGEIAVALGDRLRERAGLWTAGPPHQSVVTLWWDTPA